MLRQVLERLDDPQLAITRTFDPASLRLAVCGYEVGIEARRKVKQILQGHPPRGQATLLQSSLGEVKFWSISALGDLKAEALNIPTGGIPSPLPTAAEILLISAAHLLDPSEVEEIVNRGGLLLYCRPGAQLFNLPAILAAVRRRGTMQSALVDGSGSIDIDPSRVELTSSVDALGIFQQAFSSEPIKYHFLELYRSIELQMLYEVLREVQGNFFLDPKSTLDKARKALDSEINQILKLSPLSAVHFEEVCNVVDTASLAGNTLAVAFKQKLVRNNSPGSGRTDHGAVFVYYMRCAIVHAGDKDILYERFADGEALLVELMPSIERAAMEISGVRCL